MKTRGRVNGGEKMGFEGRRGLVREQMRPSPLQDDYTGATRENRGKEREAPGKKGEFPAEKSLDDDLNYSGLVPQWAPLPAKTLEKRREALGGGYTHVWLC